jgi:DNA repair protein RecN (Recombination protein N)
MLETLRIKNYALIDDIEVDFQKGFNVLTGETGAGKSIIVGALDLVLGARASADVLRQGADKAKVDAVFRIAKPSRRLRGLLQRHDIDLENDELILSRVVTAEGRSRAYVCGSLTSVSVLVEIGDELVDLHGQHEHQSLLKPERQLDLVDAFAGTEAAAEQVAVEVARLRELDKEIAELESDDRERTRRIEFFRFEVNEIDAAGLRPGEEEEVKARRNLIANAERIFATACHARTALYEGEESTAIGAVDGALKDLEELAPLDGRFRVLADRLHGARTEIDEIAGEIRALSDGLEFDPNELESLNQRIALIGALKRKYGGNIDAVLEYRDKAAAEIGAFESRDQRLIEMQEERNALRAEVEQAASELSRKRLAAARKLDKQVAAALQELGMKGGAFETAFERIELSLSGIDRVEFLLAANPGERVKPLRQVASGGEVSRIMLALKAVFAEADKIPTLIFDEIDAGVGGQTAKNVARKLRDLAKSHQTICITHIAQIAAAAAAHYQVTKCTAKGRATTGLALVDGENRVRELARLLDGSVSDVSTEHARVLLAGR